MMMNVKVFNVIDHAMIAHSALLARNAWVEDRGEEHAPLAPPADQLLVEFVLGHSQ